MSGGVTALGPAKILLTSASSSACSLRTRCCGRMGMIFGLQRTCGEADTTRAREPSRRTRLAEVRFLRVDEACARHEGRYFAIVFLLRLERRIHGLLPCRRIVDRPVCSWRLARPERGSYADTARPHVSLRKSRKARSSDSDACASFATVEATAHTQQPSSTAGSGRAAPLLQS